MADEAISLFAETHGRRAHRRFGIKQSDRLFHMHVVGKTGTGKTNLAETLALQDLTSGRGLTVIDPHGDFARRLVSAVPDHRRDQLCFVDVPDRAQPWGYNPLRKVRADKIPLAVSGLLEAFKKLWTDAWGVRMEHALRNALYALIEHGGAQLPDILLLLTDKDYRRSVVSDLANEQVKEFWLREYPKYNPRYQQEMISPIQNKVGAFLADPRLYRFFTSAPKELRFREIMDAERILIVNLAAGEVGEDSAHLLGALLVTTIGLAAFSRADQVEYDRRPHFVYVDEFQHFTTLAISEMISEMRKFRVGLVLLHQHIGQLQDDIRHAVLGNAGTLIAFRLGAEDAAVLGREFAPTFRPVDLLALPNYDIDLKLMIDGAPSQPFSATTLKAPLV